jgi:hypothetical protein
MTSPRSRRGWTLLEALVATAVFSLLLSTAAVCLHSLQRADAHLREQVSTAEALSRLSLRLRSDAHGASDVRHDPRADAATGVGSVVLLLEGGESIEYRAQPGQVLRFSRKGKLFVNRELYLLPPDLVPVWTIAEDEDRRLVELTVSRKTTDDAQPAQAVLRIAAMVGGGHNPVQRSEPRD